jgi:hypothetical protein
MGFEWECECEVMDNMRKGFLSFKCQSLCLVVILVDGGHGVYFQTNGKRFLQNIHLLTLKVLVVSSSFSVSLGTFFTGREEEMKSNLEERRESE